MRCGFGAVSLTFSLILSAVMAVGCASVKQEALATEALGRASALETEARQSVRERRYSEAASKQREVVALREQALGRNHPNVAQALNYLAIILQNSGDYAGARLANERALRIREQALGPNHPDVAQSLNNLGQLLSVTGDYPGAKPLLERALAIREQALGPNDPRVALTLNNLARLLWTTGDYARARPLFERTLQIREQAFGPNNPLVAETLMQFAFLLHTMSDDAEAKRLCERALKIREQEVGPNHPIVANTLNDTAVLLDWMGDYAGAKAMHERALQIREQAFGPNHPDVAQSLNNIGQLLWVTGDYPGAKPVIERALAIREQTLGPNDPRVAITLTNLAVLLTKMGDYAGARPLYERALQIRERVFGPDHPIVIQTLLHQASFLRTAGSHDEARVTYERALRSARRVGVPESRWSAALGLGETYEDEGRLAEALVAYRESVATLQTLSEQFADEESRTQYLHTSDRLKAYDALARLLLRLHEQDSTKGYDQEAWAILAAKRERVAAEALSAAPPTLEDPQARADAEQVQAHRDRATALSKALQEERGKPPSDQEPEKVRNIAELLAQTKAEYLTQVQEFLRRYPQYKSRFVDQQTIDPKALAKFADRLPANTMAVQYFAAPDRLYFFVVAPGGRFQVKSHAVSQEALYSLVKRHREYLERASSQHLPWTDDGSETYRREVVPLKEVTRELAGHLLRPIERDLGAYRNLILIPNDLLLYLPIHALTWEHEGRIRFLAETHVVSYLTQLELVDILTPSRPMPDVPLLALANPDGSLPGASQEVRALARIRGSVTTLDGAQATKSRFLTLAGKFPDLHLATHGVLNSEQPERSYLLMAGDEEGARRLTIGEISGLRLVSGLVVLSACETALGEQVPGAALTTLAAAFSLAGAQTIVASLWEVNDTATRDFMIALHSSVPLVGRAAALQRAQIALLTNPRTAHVYYWAGFILIGAR